MLMSPELVAEINTLLLFNVADPQEGIKIHKDADPALIAAAGRLHDKGLLSQPDGGYLTLLGREAAEHLHMARTIVTSAPQASSIS